LTEYLVIIECRLVRSFSCSGNTGTLTACTPTNGTTSLSVDAAATCGLSTALAQLTGEPAYQAKC
jgi:hypothetical protein